MEFTAEYWNNRYINKATGWDTGAITTPIKEYIDQFENKLHKILIPGAGNAHEAAYLFKKGFSNTFVCDWAETAIDQIKQNIPNIPPNQLLCNNFFDLEGEYNLIIEQTFFCALPPSLRPMYVQKVAQLLNSKGKLVGLLFDQEFSTEGPPFGGTKEDYQTLFEPYFDIHTMERAYNSIKPRQDKELFIIMTKK